MLRVGVSWIGLGVALLLGACDAGAVSTSDAGAGKVACEDGGDRPAQDAGGGEPPSAGEPCGAAFAPAGEPCAGASCHVCGADLYCAPGGTCQPRPTIGQPCALASGAEIAASCVELAYCDTTYAQPACLPLAPPGAPCSPVRRGAFGWVADGTGVTPPFGCADGYCGCAGGEPSCAEPLCMRTRALGDSCTTVGDRCGPGARCGEQGKCERAPGEALAAPCSAP